MTDCVKMVRLGCLKCHKHPYMLSKQSSTFKSWNFQVYKIWLPTWHHGVGNLNIPHDKVVVIRRRKKLAMDIPTVYQSGTRHAYPCHLFCIAFLEKRLLYQSTTVLLYDVITGCRLEFSTLSLSQKFLIDTPKSSLCILKHMQFSF